MTHTTSRDHDIAENSWFARWPETLRWAAFFPLAIIGSLLVSILFMIIVSLSSDTSVGSMNGGWFRLVQSALMGGAFVYIGAYVAPKQQFAVGVVMLVVFAVILSSLSTLVALSGDESLWYQALHALVAILGGGAALYAIFSETHH